jgi:PAS domain S-box-containing protein
VSALGTSVEDILERSSDAFVALDREWRYVYVNERAGQLFGRRPDELIGRHIWTEFPEGVGQTFYHAYHRALEQQVFVSLEDYYPPWDRWFENRIYPSPDGLTIFFQDITERRQAELALAERTEELDRALTAARAGTWTWELESGEVRWSNGVEAIFGLPANTFDNRFETYAQLVHPDDRATHEATLRTVLQSGERLDVTHRIVRPVDGSIRWVEGTGDVLRDESGRAVRMAGVVQDVTERAQTEAELRERERQLGEAQRVAHVGSFVWSVADDRVTWSDELYRIYGLEPGESPATFEAFLAQIHPDDRAAVEATIRSALAGEGPLQMRERIVRPSGEIRHLSSWGEVVRDAAGTPVRLVGICQDVTERREAELRRERLTERLNTLHEIDLAILGANSAATVAGIALSRLVALLPGSAAQLVVFDEATQSASVLAAAPAAFARAEPWESPRRGKHRPAVVADLAAEPTTVGRRRLAADGWRSLLEAPLIANGRCIGALTLVSREAGAYDDERVAVVREVAAQLAVATQQSEYRERIERHSEELEQRVVERTQELQEANAELESFSYSVAHDLRAPLRAVQGLTQALIEDYVEDLDETGRDYCRRIVGAVQRMDLLIQDLLAYAKLSRSEPSRGPVSLAGVVREVLAQQEPEIAARDSTVEVAEPLPDVVGHHATLMQVVGNLVSNALKFVAPGVRPHVVVRADDADGRVRLWVEDNGIGIEPVHQARIFRIFERLHGVEAYPGTGIGLAIVRKGTERLGGSTAVESEPGRGSRFCVVLPGIGEDDS